MKRWIAFAVACMLFIFGMSYAVSSKPDQIPIKLLFGNPERSSPTISPDGRHLAFIAPREGVLNLWIRNIANGEEFPVTNDRHRGVRDYRWGYDNTTLLFPQDNDGDENWNIYSVDINTKDTKKLTPFHGVQVKIIEYSWKHPNEIMIAMNKEARELFDLYRVDLKTGSHELIYKNSGDIGTYFIDKDLQVVGCLRYNDDGSTDVLVKGPNGLLDKSLIHWTISEDMMGGIVGVFNNSFYALDARGRDTASLVEVEMATGKTHVIYEDEHYDVSEVYLDPMSGKVMAVGVYDERFKLIPIQEEYKRDVQFLREQLSDTNIYLKSVPLDATKCVVITEADNQTPRCYLYDRSLKKLDFLFDFIPELSRYQLVKMEPISFQARDGLTIEGYLTLPGEGAKNVPMILMVHGGPQSRDTWGYRSAVQWLANRGYAVLQLNYRGSKGYGKVHLDAGIREWGNKMQHDLTDGVHWAVQKGVADPDRIAIFGGSYGGYAALAGAAFTPKLYKAAVDVVGPSNLISLLKTIPPYWKMYKAQFTVRVGDPVADEALLRERSPLFSADKICIPILIGQGANDPRVKQSESEQIVAALKANQVPHEYIVYPDEGHGFGRPENRIDFYKRMEIFLAKYLRCER